MEFSYAAPTAFPGAQDSIKGPVRKLCEFCQIAKQSDFQRPVAMDRNGQAYYAARSPIDMVTALNAKKGPAVTLNQTRKFAS